MNILFLSHRLPYAPNRGDRIRAYHLLREMSRWATIDVISLAHDDEEASHAGDLRAAVRSVTIARVPRFLNYGRAALALPTSRPTTHSLLDSPEMNTSVDSHEAERRPDVVFCYCTGIAPAAFRPSLTGVPVVLDMVDVDSAKWASLAKTAPFPMSSVYRREARVLRAFEVEAMRRASVTLAINAREQQDLLEMLPTAHVVVVENGVDVESFRPEGDPTGEPVVVFCGVMDYEPNVDAALWLAREVWPVVRREHPAARLDIVGARPSTAVRGIASGEMGIRVTGSVPDVRPYLWGSAIAVAPLQTARGTQNKVLEAVAAGLPTVVTPVVMSGLPDQVKSACAVGDSSASFAALVGRMLSLSAMERRSIAACADLDALRWPRRLDMLANIVGSVCLP